MPTRYVVWLITASDHIGSRRTTSERTGSHLTTDLYASDHIWLSWCKRLSVGGKQELNCKKNTTQNAPKVKNSKWGPFWEPKAKNLWGGGTASPQWGRGYPLPTPHPLQRLNLRAYGTLSTPHCLQHIPTFIFSNNHWLTIIIRIRIKEQIARIKSKH